MTNDTANTARFIKSNLDIKNRIAAKKMIFPINKYTKYLILFFDLLLLNT